MAQRGNTSVVDIEPALGATYRDRKEALHYDCQGQETSLAPMWPQLDKKAWLMTRASSCWKRGRFLLYGKQICISCSKRLADKRWRRSQFFLKMTMEMKKMMTQLMISQWTRTSFHQVQLGASEDPEDGYT